MSLTVTLRSLAILVLLPACSETGFTGGQEKNYSSPKPAKPTPVISTPSEPLPPVASVPSQNIEFGDDKVFHIGDGKFTSSSCKDQIESYEHSGTKYFFEFEVLEANTEVDVAIQSICGVDNENANFLSLGSQKISFQIGQTSATLPKSSLPIGRHALIVESTLMILKNDSDDFVVGKVHIKANKKITPIGVRTE